MVRKLRNTCNESPLRKLFEQVNFGLIFASYFMMGKLKILVIVFFTMLAAGEGFSQTGELDRFPNQELEDINSIQLFPNPTIEFLNVKIINSTLESPSVVVHNIIGSEVEVEVNEVRAGEFLLKVKDLKPGYYLVAIRDDKGAFSETYKFLKR